MLLNTLIYYLNSAYARYSNIDINFNPIVFLLLLLLNLFFLIIALQYQAITKELDIEKKRKSEVEARKASRLSKLYPKRNK
tara:strand:+ start:1378 stop:1620 length:243 start_codon:yes stop_codon:yes gene_type:complete